MSHLSYGTCAVLGGVIAVAATSVVSAVPAAQHGQLRPAGSCKAVQASQVAGWIDQAGTKLHRRWTVTDCRALLLMAERESNNRADAVNGWDRNAKVGHPTKGILQARDDTFEAHAPAGCHGRILDPVCNIAACADYAIGRYGSLANVPGVRAVREGRPYVGY